MAGLKKEVVGRKPSSQPSGTMPAPTTTTVSGGYNFLNNINSRLASLGVSTASSGSLSTAGVWADSLSKTQRSEMAIMFKKLGYNVKSVKDLELALMDFPDVTQTTSYADGYKILASQVIDTTGLGGPSVTQTITKYDDKYLTSVANSIAQDFLGRNLQPGEAEKILPKLKDIVNKGTTTTSKKVGGKNVVTTTPGFSQAAAQDVVQTELRLGASKDLQTKQYEDFADWLSKNMAGM